MSNTFNLTPPPSLTDFEKAVLNLEVEPGLNETFLNVADNAVPDANIWTVSTGATCTVEVMMVDGGESWCRLHSAQAANRAGIDTFASRSWTADREGVTEVHFLARFRVLDLTSNWGLGLAYHGATIYPGVWQFSNQAHAGIYGDNDIVYTGSGDDVSREVTDISAYVTTDNTWYDLKIVVTTTDVKYYIDTVLVDTDTVNVPDWPMAALVASELKNAVNADLDVEKIQTWIV